MTQQYRYILLVGLYALFLFRVLIELVTRLFPDYFGSAQVYSSGLISYSWLLAAQLSILWWMTNVVRFNKDTSTYEQSWLIHWIRVFALAYFCFMAVRFAIAITGLSNSVFFSKPIPAFFHCVIAMFIYVQALPVCRQLARGEIHEF